MAHIGIMEKKMETIIIYIWLILGEWKIKRILLLKCRI